MSLKLNIYPDINEEIEHLLPESECRSKTEYINEAIREYNAKLSRKKELEKLKKYFATSGYKKESQKILNEFSHARSRSTNY